MLETKLQDKFVALLSKLLPDGLTRTAVNFFGLKIPITPAALATSILSLTVSLMRQLDKTVADFPEALTKDAVGVGLGIDVASEILCGLYAQAVAVLREGEPDDEQYFFQLYTAKTFDELCKQVSETIHSIRELEHETSDLYFNDHPSLAELAEQMPDYVFKSEVKQVQDMNNWMAAFSLKAEIRVLNKMKLSNKRLCYPILKIVIGTGFTHRMTFFKTLRPILDGF
jgi:hypothetical protein